MSRLPAEQRLIAVSAVALPLLIYPRTGYDE
jgi:hypothetical protein